MRLLGYAIGATAILIQANVGPAGAYDVAPGCSKEEFIEFLESDYSPEEIIEMCKFEFPEEAESAEAVEISPSGNCRGLDCYETKEGKFINGQGIAQQPAEPDHTAQTCANRCNKAENCLSFELYEDDLCSLNGVNTKTNPDILLDSEHYVYYEHLYRGNAED